MERISVRKQVTAAARANEFQKELYLRARRARLRAQPDAEFQRLSAHCEPKFQGNRALLEGIDPQLVATFQLFDAELLRHRAEVGELVRRRGMSGGAAQKSRQPTPRFTRTAEMLLSHLLSPNDYVVLQGDLTEAYRKRLRRIGKERADLWYRRQLLTSIPPLIWQACRRLVHRDRRKEQP